MTNRELFHATMNFANGKELLHLEHGFWPELLDDWRKEGWGQGVSDPEVLGMAPEPDVFDHFNICQMAYYTINQHFLPGLKSEVISEKDGRRTTRDEIGTEVEVRTDGASLPHTTKFGIKDKVDYLAVRDRLIGNFAQRATVYDLSTVGPAAQKQQDHIVGLHINGPFAFLRDILGVENAMMIPYLDPELTRMILDDHLEVCKQAGEITIKALKPDFCFIWEDSTYKNGPMVSPSLFEEFHLPFYKEWTAFVKECGVKYSIVDTDGDPTALLPLWIQGGIDGMLPWEANAVDIVKVAEDFPDLVLFGGVSKHALEKDAAAIDEELQRVLPALSERGGYIAALDHHVPQGVSLANFRHYCNRLVDYGKANTSTRFEK